METQSQDSKSSAITRALAVAKARKAQKDALNGVEASDSEDTSTSTPESKALKQAAKKAEREARAALKAERLATESTAKAEKRAAKLAAKAERKAAKEAAKASSKPSHMKKVDKARAKCPSLDPDTQITFGEITANFSAQQINALAQHLLVHNRAMQTQLATSSPQLPLGSTVRITGGEPKYIGLTGEVVHSQKLRAKVQVAGFKKPVYIYSCEAEQVSESAAKSA